jgi:hypothetical protein
LRNLEKSPSEKREAEKQELARRRVHRFRNKEISGRAQRPMSPAISRDRKLPRWMNIAAPGAYSCA